MRPRAQTPVRRVGVALCVVAILTATQMAVLPPDLLRAAEPGCPMGMCSLDGRSKCACCQLLGHDVVHRAAPRPAPGSPTIAVATRSCGDACAAPGGGIKLPAPGLARFAALWAAPPVRLAAGRGDVDRGAELLDPSSRPRAPPAL